MFDAEDEDGAGALVAGAAEVAGAAVVAGAGVVAGTAADVGVAVDVGAGMVGAWGWPSTVSVTGAMVV